MVRKRKQGEGTGARASTNSSRGGSSAEGSGYPEKGSPGNSNGQCKDPGVGSQHPYNSLQSPPSLVSGDLRTLLIPIGTKYIHAVHTYMHMHTHIHTNESFLEEQISLSQSFQLDYEYGNIGFSPIKN